MILDRVFLSPETLMVFTKIVSLTSDRSAEELLIENASNPEKKLKHKKSIPNMICKPNTFKSKPFSKNTLVLNVFDKH